jgi:hypothetical protein
MLRNSGWIWTLLVSSAILAGCALTSTGDTYRGQYPDCPPDSYLYNADCYGGPP